jgi:glycogen synthase kinase 3 beta
MKIPNENEYIQEYIPLTVKGSGSFGQVIELYDNDHNCFVAVKRTHKSGDKFSRELEILSKIKGCKYVVSKIDTYYTGDFTNKIIQNIILDYTPQSLDIYMRALKEKNMHIPIKSIKNIAKQILKGLYYCHKKNIVHRDLKPENILISNDEKIEICDFGSSKIIDKYSNNDKMVDIDEEIIIRSTPYISSRFYRAPELLLSKADYDTKIDIFSLGEIIGELFTLESLFMGKDEGSQLFEYINVLGLPDSNYLEQFKIPKEIKEYLKNFKVKSTYSWEEILNKENIYDKKDIDDVSDLLYKMMKWDYNERYSAKQCLKHKFFKDS